MALNRGCQVGGAGGLCLLYEEDVMTLCGWGARLGGGCLFWSQDKAWGCLFPEGYLGEWGGTDRDTHTWGCALWVDAEAVLCATGAVMHSGGGVKLLSPPPPLIWAQPQFSRSRKLRRGETESTVTPPPPSVCMCVCVCVWVHVPPPAGRQTSPPQRPGAQTAGPHQGQLPQPA